MDIQQRIVRFVTKTNWILLFLACLCSLAFASADFVRGILFGGLLVTINFHLLARTLKKAFTSNHIPSHFKILAKYYIRFFISGVIIFILIASNYVDPLGLIIGLSIVVASMMIATFIEFKKLIFKEAV